MHGKISPTMYSGSMVGAGAMAFALMPYCIANARPDENSCLDLNPQVLSAIFGEPVGEIQKAIAYLCLPDPHSRSKDEGGKRLVHTGPGPFRYRVVNLQKYRDEDDREYRTEYWRQHKQWQRSGRKGQFKFNSTMSTPLSTVSTGQSTSVHPADADADADAKVRTPHVPTVRVEKCLPNPIRGEESGVVLGIGRMEWLKERLEEMYNRPKGRQWGCEEDHLLVEIANRPDHKEELFSIQKFRPKVPARSFPQSLLKLLTGWDSTLDRARTVTTYDDRAPEKSLSQKDHEAAMRRISAL